MKLTNTRVTSLLIAVLTRALIRPLRIAAGLLASVRASFTLVHVATVGAVLVHLVASPAQTLVRALRVLTELLAGRRSHAALVHVRAHVARRLVATTAYAAETDK